MHYRLSTDVQTEVAQQNHSGGMDSGADPIDADTPAINTLFRCQGPSLRILVWIGLSALIFRATLVWGFASTSGMSMSEVALARDGEQFAAYAYALVDRPIDAKAVQPDAYTLRLFPLTSAMYALVHGTGIPMHLAMLLVSWVSSALACALAAAFLRSVAIGWLMVVITPSWLLCSAIPSTEAVYLCFVMIGLLLARHASTYREGKSATSNGLTAAGGLLLGLGGLARPVACFAVAGAMLGTYMGKRIGQVCLMGTIALGTVIAGYGWVWLRFGGMVTLQGYAQSSGAYAEGGILDWPFASLIRTPLIEHAPLWKVGYVGVHVAASLVGCGLLIRQAVWPADISASQQRASPTDDTGGVSQPSDPRLRWLPTCLAVWACGTVLFALCTGDRWGFHEFPRFIVPCLPALLFAYRRRWTYGQWWVWGSLAVASVGMAYVAIQRSF